ncbi:unnamed protein product [Triticum aestivum]|uniref:Uncharacterized protein n=5 Tax=Triticinae TaxID=1648030 RepID=A0A9R1EW36_WHEAT|nr:uncharacterized protein LOC109744527 [Aegilops tauschii subsp. strangulata]XP_044328395.1 uncharacterized protein LOC123049560 [Triticum aestivum]KAF7017147.1 hypothetical protein CFC21_030629 [Triticum aestivum]SPT18904.1 unnamed protein product [Triticum aestivum]
MFLHHLLVQNMAKNTHQPRSKDGGGAARARGLSKKSPWYQRAVELLLLIWKQPAGAPTTTKAAAAAGVSATGKAAAAPAGPGRLRKSSSLNVAASFTRVCLCAPISSYNEPSLYFQPGDVAPRRSYSYPRASSSSASGCGANANANPLVAPPPGAEPHRGASGGGEAARRPVFRGKSLTDDHLMRRFVVDEGATRRRNQMEVIRRRHATAAKRRRLGPSPLRRMVLAESESEGEDEAVAETQQRERKRAEPRSSVA